MFNLVTNMVLCSEESAWQIDGSSWQFWTLLAIAGALLIAGIFLYKKKNYTKIAFAIFSFVALIVAIISLVFDINHHIEKYGAEWGYHLYQTYFAITAILTFSGFLVFSLFSFIKNQTKTIKIIKNVLGYALLLSAIGMLITAFVEVGNSTEVYDGELFKDFSVASQIVITVITFLIVICMAGYSSIKTKSDKGKNDTMAIVYGSMSIALSFALSYIKLFSMPFGGSVTLASLLPLTLYCYMFGTKKGLMAALIYGILQLIQEPWIVHPAQVMTDYLIAFGVFGFAGIFNKIKNKPLGFGCAILFTNTLRYLSHFVGGAIFFGVSGAEGGNPWIYSAGYNSVVFVDMAIVLVLGVGLMCSKSFVKVMNDAQNRYLNK